MFAKQAACTGRARLSRLCQLTVRSDQTQTEPPNTKQVITLLIITLRTRGRQREAPALPAPSTACESPSAACESPQVSHSFEPTDRGSFEYE